MPLGKLLEQDNATVHRMMAINYGGLVNIAQAALPAMVRRGAGDFISFSSMAGIIPILMTGGYNASKFAVSAFTEVLWHENRASGVRFACVCPPPVATPLLAQGYATVMPKTIESMPPIEPREVLEAIESRAGEGRVLGLPGQGHAHGISDAAFLPEPHLERCAQEGRFLASSRPGFRSRAGPACPASAPQSPDKSGRGTMSG